MRGLKKKKGGEGEEGRSTPYQAWFLRNSNK